MFATRTLRPKLYAVSPLQSVLADNRRKSRPQVSWNEYLQFQGLKLLWNQSTLSENGACKSSRMNTCKIEGLEVLWNEYLQKHLGGHPGDATLSRHASTQPSRQVYPESGRGACPEHRRGKRSREDRTRRTRQSRLLSNSMTMSGRTRIPPATLCKSATPVPRRHVPAPFSPVGWSVRRRVD